MMNKFENNLEMQILDFATDKRSEWEKNHKLYSVVFELTPNCNFNCVHCYLCNHHSSKELSFSEIVEILDILLKDNGYLRNIVIYMFIANEGISILENWSAMGIKVPDIIKDKSSNLKGGDDDEQNK